MRDITPPPPTRRPTLEKPRARKEAAKVLAIAIQTRYRRFLEASGDDEIVVATGDLAQCMYENVEFVIWALKSVGGMNPAPPEELSKISKMGMPLFPKPPEMKIEEPIPANCTCPPLEAGIIGRDRHMTSCPSFVP